MSTRYSTYVHYKPDGSIFYIGKGSLKRAHSSHGRNIFWKRTVEKCGGFKTQILAWWKTEQEAFDHEIFLIDTFKNMGHKLTNIAEGGLGSTGFRHTEEHKESIRQMMLERNPMFNSIYRANQIAALNIAMKRPEVRAHQRKVKIGIKLSESHIESLRNCHPTRPCIVNGIKYKSLMEASRILEILHGTLYRWLNNPKIKHTGKYAHIVEARWF